MESNKGFLEIKNKHKLYLIFNSLNGLFLYFKIFKRSHLPLSEDTCLIGVGGAIEASAPALAHFPGRILNALDVAEVDNHLLVVVGTKDGEVIQVG